MQYIDNLFAVIIYGGHNGFSDLEWSNFKKDMDDFGSLRWEVNKPSNKVDYLDVTLEINGRHIVSKTYQKPINLYQYITPTSAHPRGMIKGVIHGMILQYWKQNSQKEDFWHICMLFYKRLRARGWDRATIEPIFITAYNKISHQPEEPPTLKKQRTESPSFRDLMIIHLEYHPDDIPRKKIREIYSQHCAEKFESILGIQRTIVAYSNPPNLRDLLQSAKLFEQKGSEVSTFLGG